ncbi:DUF5591 domain-containing protein [Methanopyrus sp.]
MSVPDKVRVIRCDCARVLEVKGVETPAPFFIPERLSIAVENVPEVRELVKELEELVRPYFVRLTPVDLPSPWTNLAEAPSGGSITVYRLESIPDAREFAEVVSKIRRSGSVRAVTVRDPEWIPVLFYLGFDLFDAALCLRLTLEDRLLLDDFSTETVETEDREELLRENWTQLQFCLLRLREAIREGTLRELVESVAARHPRIAEVLRFCDRKCVIARYVNMNRNTQIACATDLSFDRPEVTEWLHRVRRYEPPDWAEAVVLLPCSARKPYSRSPTHRRITRITWNFPVDEIIITSPLGAVPRTLERTFPAAHYDVRVTGEWSREEIERSAALIEKIVEDLPIVCHASDGYRKVGEELEERGYDVVYTCRPEGNPASRGALEELRRTLKDLTEGEPGDLREHIPRAVSRFQFGVDVLEDVDYRFDGQRVLIDGERAFSVPPTSGLLTLSQLGAELCVSSRVPPVHAEEGTKAEVVDVPEDVLPGFHWPVDLGDEIRPCRVIARPEDVPPDTTVVETR